MDGEQETQAETTTHSVALETSEGVQQWTLTEEQYKSLEMGLQKSQERQTAIESQITKQNELLSELRDRLPAKEPAPTTPATATTEQPTNPAADPATLVIPTSEETPSQKKKGRKRRLNWKRKK